MLSTDTISASRKSSTPTANKLVYATGEKHGRQDGTLTHHRHQIYMKDPPMDAENELAGKMLHTIDVCKEHNFFISSYAAIYQALQ